MKVTSDMKIKDVLAMGEEKMIETLTWIAPEFERLRYAKLRRAMSGRVSVEQAARIARVPLTEILYVLNLAVSANEEELTKELRLREWTDFEYRETNPPVKPLELINLKDTDAKVLFIDLMPLAEEKRDPMPVIAKGLVSLDGRRNVLLLKHPFDPIPLRDMFARRGLASWAEERNEGVWFIYFYRPSAAAFVTAHPPVNNKVFVKVMTVAI